MSKYKKWYKGVPIGIKDINGKDICEGDTVKYWRVGKESQVLDQVVQYSEDLCAFTVSAILWLQQVDPLKGKYKFEIQNA